MAAIDSRASRRTNRFNLPDPAYWVWKKLTSVKLAIVQILIVLLFALTAVVIPQVPAQFTDDPIRIAEHVELQRSTWGPFTDILANFPWFYDANGGIFNLFNQPYWYLAVVLLSLSITTCTVSRFPPVWRTVRRPQRRVTDAYFERARNRLAFATPADADLIAATFRKQHYRVRTEQRDGATYLFADRFGWAQLGTFLSHLGLIMLVMGTVVTKVGAEEFQFWLGEGQSRPLFPTGGDRQQVQVIVDDAVARFSDQGQALDFRSAVRVTSGGAVIAAGEVTVNGPLGFNGWRVHQAAYWEHGAALQVRDASSGQLIYSETLMLDREYFGPRVTTTSVATGQRFADEVVALSYEVEAIADSGYQLIPLAPESSIALVLLPTPDGGFDFYYAVVPIAADAPEAAGLTAADLHLNQPPPIAPRIRLRDTATGDLFADSVVSLSLFDGATDLRLGFIPLSEGETLAVGYRDQDGERFFTYGFQSDALRGGFLAPGERADLGGFELEYVGEEPDRSLWGRLEPGQSQRIGGVELGYGGAESVFFREELLPGAPAPALVLLERFGQARTASLFEARGGENVDLAVSALEISDRYADRPARLGIGLGGGQPRIDLQPGESAVVGDYEYAFLGPREFTGLAVRRDPGAIVFWIAVLAGLGGLMITFFVPRRRIWAKVTPDRTYLAGLAGHGVNLRSEMAKFARTVGAPDAPPEEDWDNE